MHFLCKYYSILPCQSSMPASRQEGWTRQTPSCYQANWQSSQDPGGDGRGNEYIVRGDERLGQELKRVHCPWDERLGQELKHLEDALRLMDSLLFREARDDFEFATAENSPRRDKGGDAGEHDGGGEDGGSGEGESGGF